MTLTLRQTEIKNHYICLEIDKTGLYKISDNMMADDCSYGYIYKHETFDKANANATYNRYVRRYK